MENTREPVVAVTEPLGLNCKVVASLIVIFPESDHGIGPPTSENMGEQDGGVPDKLSPETW